MTSKSAASVSFHASGKMPSARVERLLRQRLDALGIGHLLTPRRQRERAAELVDDDADARRRGCVAPGQGGFEIGVGLGGAVPERDRLLHLEVERHPAVVDPAAVLDRHEREEAQELARPALLLLGGQRRGAEARQRLVERGARLVVGGLVAGERSRGKRLRSLVEAGRCGRSALLAVGRREDAGVARPPASPRSPPGLRSPRSTAWSAASSAGVQPSLVGVEQVGAYRRQRRFGGRGSAASAPSASVASAPGREKRVGLRNSRTSSQARAEATSPAAMAAATAS